MGMVVCPKIITNQLDGFGRQQNLGMLTPNIF